MPLVQNLKFHDYQFEVPVSSGKWRWTTRLDVSQSSPAYSIRDIISPYGLLRDSIPIPGNVVQSMSDSIQELRSNFAPNILIGPPTQLIFEIDEGRGFSVPQSVLVTNNGVYGSILGVSLTTSASYIRVSPSTVGNLSINESGEFAVEADSKDLVAIDSPYHETITIQDPTSTNNPQTIPVTINVRPKSTIALVPIVLTFSVVRPLDGVFPYIPPQTFVVQNIGLSGSVLEYDIRALTGLCNNWLRSWLPASGVLSSGQSQIVTVTVQPPNNLLQGLYSEKLRVSGYSSNCYLDIEIRLVIT
jgi:hypothetical protein